MTMPQPPIARLLIVDDERANTEALQDTLEAENYHVVAFTSPAAALEALHEQEFDLILSDLMMPEIDGITLLRKAFDIDPNLIGIVMTGHGTIDTAVRAMQAGALDYILKPFTLMAILPVLARALSVRRLRTENVQLHEAVGIYKLSMAVSFTLDFDAVLQKVADAAILQGQVRGVSILIPSDDGTEFYVAEARGEEAAAIRGVRIPFTPSLSAWLERSRRLLALSQDGGDLPALSVAPLGDIPCSLSIPMLTGGKLAGILNFSSEEPRRLTAPGRSRALCILASAAAAAIERASLITRLRGAEQRYRRLAENAPDMVFRYELHPAPRFSYVNPTAKQVTGYSPDDYYDDPGLCLRIVHPDDRPLLERQLRGDSTSANVVVLRCIHKAGKTIWMEQRIMLVRDEQGELAAIEGIVRDITERKLAEEKTRGALQEKDVMLNEIHHRVKNNLQVVSSLLSMQAERAHDPASRRMLADCQNRIQSMALIHQQLYSSSNFAEIDFSSYLHSLTNHLLASYATEKTAVSVRMNAGLGALSLEEAIPCGLIVNELFSNSLKHSFEGQPTGEIRVGFSNTDGVCALTVDDDGLPLPHDVLARQSGKMGLRLVQALTAQLRGTLQVNAGQKFMVTFAQKPQGELELVHQSATA